MSDFEGLAVDHPTLRRVVIITVVAVLLAYVVVTRDRPWTWQGLCSLILAIGSGAAAALVASRADSALYRHRGDRATRWARTATALGATAGSVGGVALARAGSVRVAPVLVCLLVGFLAAAAFLYPLPQAAKDRRSVPK